MSLLPGVCSVFAKALAHYGITNTRLPLESRLSECHWMTDWEKKYFSFVVNNCKEAKQIFANHCLRWVPCATASFECLGFVESHSMPALLEE
jgi:hypothetical protein